MMSLERRLRAVERVLGTPGQCPACRGEGGGPWIVVWMLGTPKPVIAGCPGCGQQRPLAARIVLCEPEPAEVEQP